MVRRLKTNYTTGTIVRMYPFFISFLVLQSPKGPLHLCFVSLVSNLSAVPGLHLRLQELSTEMRKRILERNLAVSGKRSIVPQSRKVSL